MTDLPGIVERLLRQLDLASGSVSVIEQNRSLGADAVLAVLAFVEGRKDPVAFIKATTNAEKAGALEREHGNLSELHRRGGEEFRRTIPKPLFFGDRDGLTLLAESAIPGGRMKDLPPNRYFRSPSFRRHFALVVKWLHEFHRIAPGSDAPISNADLQRSIEQYRADHRVSPALNDLLAETLDLLESVKIPSIPTHGDFCTANILVPADDRVAVIDWEFPLVRSWPLADLLYFISSTWCVPYSKGPLRRAENYRALFFADHHFADLLKASGRRYAERLNIAPDLLLPLSVVSWVDHANRKQELLRAMDRPGSERAPGAEHLPLVMIEDGHCLNLELLAENRKRLVFRE